MDRNQIPTSTLNLLVLGGLVILFSLFTAQLPVCAESHAADIDVKAIIKGMDELYRSETSQTSMEMQIVTPHWERTLTLEIWTTGDGQDLHLDYITEKRRRVLLPCGLGMKCGTISPRRTR